MQVTKCVVLFVVALAIVCMPAMAARVSVFPILHETEFVYQAYAGQAGTIDEPDDVAFLGYAGFGTVSVITAVPGVFSFTPGPAWVNFVGAANANSLGGIWDINGDGVADYTIKNVVLVKKTPSFIQCDQVYAPKTVQQQGTAAIRTWWPLMYEAPGTKWTLTILYGTAQLRLSPTQVQDYDDDGIGLGVNPPSTVHQETWEWQVDVTFQSLVSLIELFHEIPFGMDEVPLISNEALVGILIDKLEGVEDLLASGDNAAASLLLGDFELEVQDACIDSSPASPWVTGSKVGIAQTFENPACCKLLVDVEYLSGKYGIFAAKK